MPKLTKRFIESITPDPRIPLSFWDDEIKRFGVVVRPSGGRTYYFEYRDVHHVKKRIKLGIHGPITPTQARYLARLQLSKVLTGVDLAETNQANS